MQIFIITGTSRGLGKALVGELSKESSTEIFALSREKEVMVGTIKNVHHRFCDLLDTQSLPKVMQEVFESLDPQAIDSITLINNAGVLSPIKSIQDASIDEISNNIEVNLKSLAIMTSLFLKATQAWEKAKMVINISSGAATKPYDGWSVYCASKAGVDLFTRCIALEQARQKFPATIFSFYPGVIDTDMQGLIRQSKKEDFPALDRFIDYKEKGQLLLPEVVAKKLLALARSGKVESGGIYNVEEL